MSNNEVRVGIDLDTMRAMALQGVLANPNLCTGIAGTHERMATKAARLAYEAADEMYKLVKNNG